MRRLKTAHHLNDYVQFRIIKNDIKIVNKNFFHRISREFAKVKHIFDADRNSRAFIDLILIFPDYFSYAASNSAISQYCNVYHNDYQLSV